MLIKCNQYLLLLIACISGIPKIDKYITAYIQKINTIKVSNYYAKFRNDTINYLLKEKKEKKLNSTIVILFNHDSKFRNKRFLLPRLINSIKRKKVKFVHSSWNLKTKEKKHKVHLGALKKTSNKTKTLSEVLNKIRKKIDFIKIDVDGYEINVLRSGKEIINKYKPLIYFEFAPYLYKEFGYSTETLIDFIKNELKYTFLNENFDEVKNIYEIGKKLNDRSINFFLIHKTNLSKFKTL